MYEENTGYGTITVNGKSLIVHDHDTAWSADGTFGLALRIMGKPIWKE